MEQNKNSIKDIKDRIPVKQNFNLLRPYKVSVEGNIGAGKTTVINYFTQFAGVETYTEPIDWWRNLNGHNLLELLYTDINKWYNVFQKYVQLTRVQIQTMPAKYSHTTTQIFERSIQNNRNTFVEQAFSAGYLKPPEYEVLTQWYDWVIENIDVEIDFIVNGVRLERVNEFVYFGNVMSRDGRIDRYIERKVSDSCMVMGALVYLRTSPEIVYERMKSRGRLEESEVPFKYIKELHDFHEKWLLSDPKIDKDKILIIDANQSFNLVLKQCEENKDKVISKNLIQKSDEHKIF